MSYRWDVEEAEAPRPAPGAAWNAPRAERDEATGPSPVARRRLLKTLAVTALLGFGAAAGWRWWAGQRLIREIQRDVEAAVMLEEAAVADGDWALFIQRQSRSRARELRAAQRAYGRQLVHAPIGGLEIASAEPELQRIEVDTDVPVGEPIRRVTVTLEHRVADGFGGGAFREARPYVLSNKGNWIHTLPPARDERVEAWRGERIDARLFGDEREQVEPLLRRADEILVRFCEEAGHCERALTAQERRSRRRDRGRDESVDAARDREPYRVPLSLTGEVPGAFGYEVHDRRRFLRIPSPARTWAPADAESEAVWVRELARIAALDIAEAVSGELYLNLRGTPNQDLSSRAPLLLALFDQWLVSEGLVPELAMGADEMDADRPTLQQLWPHDGFTSPPLMEQLEERGQRLAELARYLDRQGGSSGLSALIGGLAEAEGPMLWLDGAFGDDAMRVALTWNGALEPFVADRAMTLRCAPAVTDPGILLYQPGAEGPVDLGPSACGREASLDARWRPPAPGGRSDLAVLCSDGYDIAAPMTQGDAPEAGLSSPILALLPAASRAVSEASPAGDPVRLAIGDVTLRQPTGLSWSADGEYLAWVSTIPYGDAPALRILGVDEALLSGEREPVIANIFLRPWENRVDLSEEPRLTVASQVRFRWAPVGRRIVMETRDRSVAVVELPPSAELQGAPAARWTSPGHDPVWSPDGRRIAMIAPAGEAAPGTVRMKVLDAETGAELAAADFDLPSQLAAQAESEGFAPAFEYVRVRTGDWSPDAALASMALTARLKRDTPPGRSALDWLGLATLDAETGRTRQTSGAGSAYLEGRDRFTFWTGSADADGRRVTLTYYDPEWMAGLQAVIRAEPEIVGSEDPPVGISLNVDKGSAGVITVQEAVDAGLPTTFDSPDGRWALRVEGRMLGGTPDYGLALVERGRGAAAQGAGVDAAADAEGAADGDAEPIWRLRGNWCNDVQWAP